MKKNTIPWGWMHLTWSGCMAKEISGFLYNIEEVNNEYIRGWVVNKKNPDLLVEGFLKFKKSIIPFVNDIKRNDLAKKGISPNGVGGFKIYLPENLKFKTFYIKFSEQNDFFEILSDLSLKKDEDIAKLRKHIIENKAKVNIKSISDFMTSIGLDCINYKAISANSHIELPTRLNHSNLRNSIYQAFSYLGKNCEIYDTEMGRYCSFGSSVSIGHGNHPLDWLSTNPFQYQNSFRIRNGILFDYHKEYSEYQPDINMSHKAMDSVRRPKTIIGNDVWIAKNVIVLPGVSIGNGAIIGAGSIVTKDIPAYAIAAGNPAKVIRYRFPEGIIEELLELQWWKYAPWDLVNHDIDFSNITDAINKINELEKSNIIYPYSGHNYKMQDLLKLYEELFN